MEKHNKVSTKQESTGTSATPVEKIIHDSAELKVGDFGACENCHTNIKGQAVHALGKVWHPEHFVCTTCKKPISGQIFNVHDGKPFCEQDYSNKFLQKCRSCGLPIKDVTIQALGSTWHKDHFVCTSCNVQLSGKGFFERENNPFCQKCFENQFSPKCAGCNESITETAMMALGKNYHVGCFKCSKCKKTFDDSTTFQIVGNQPVCSSCSHR